MMDDFTVAALTLLILAGVSALVALALSSCDWFQRFLDALLGEEPGPR